MMTRARIPSLALVSLVALLSCGPSPTGGPTGEPPDAPAKCSASSGCPGRQPVCHEGVCVPCRDDADCGGGSECRLCMPDGRCLNSVECCRGDLDCPGTFECERPAGAPVGRCTEEGGGFR